MRGWSWLGSVRLIDAGAIIRLSWLAGKAQIIYFISLARTLQMADRNRARQGRVVL